MGDLHDLSAMMKYSLLKSFSSYFSFCFISFLPSLKIFFFKFVVLTHLVSLAAAHKPYIQLLSTLYENTSYNNRMKIKNALFLLFKSRKKVKYIT